MSQNSSLTSILPFQITRYMVVWTALRFVCQVTKHYGASPHQLEYRTSCVGWMNGSLKRVTKTFNHCDCIGLWSALHRKWDHFSLCWILLVSQKDLCQDFAENKTKNQLKKCIKSIIVTRVLSYLIPAINISVWILKYQIHSWLGSTEKFAYPISFFSSQKVGVSVNGRHQCGMLIEWPYEYSIPSPLVPVLP